MTTIRMAQIIARAVVRLVGGDQRIVVLGKDEEGLGYRLVVLQGRSMMDRSFESFPDAFARFWDYANGILVRRSGVLLLEVPEGVDVWIERLPPQEELLAAWERIGGKIQEEGAGDGG
jgi:hypothetical protein